MELFSEVVLTKQIDGYKTRFYAGDTVTCILKNNDVIECAKIIEITNHYIFTDKMTIQLDHIDSIYYQ